MTIKETQEQLKELLLITHKNSKGAYLPKLYSNWITEEYNELMKEEPYTPNDFKELCDLIWVCIQYANACEYDLEKGFEELNKEYNSKFYDKDGHYNPIFRDDGKLLKNTGFKKADFEQFFVNKDKDNDN